VVGGIAAPPGAKANRVMACGGTVSGRTAFDLLSQPQTGSLAGAQRQWLDDLLPKN